MGRDRRGSHVEALQGNVPRRRFLGSGLLAAAAAALGGVVSRERTAAAQGSEFVVLGAENFEKTPTGLTNMDGEGAAFIAIKQTEGMGHLVQVASPNAGIELGTEGLPGVKGFSNKAPGAIFSSTLPLTEALSHAVGVVGVGEQRGGFFFHGNEPEPIPLGPPSGVTGFSSYAPGGIFSSTLPLSEALSHAVGVVGVGQQGGGFFFHTNEPGFVPEPFPGAGVQGIATDPKSVGVFAQNTAPDGEALNVSGKATFSRSGKATVPAGSRTAIVTGVPLTEASLILATAQETGGYVKSVIPNVTESSFTIGLNRPPTVDVTVGWFVVN